VFSESFMAEPKPANLEIGQVLGGAFLAIGRNWLMFLALTLILVAAPLVATQLTLSQFPAKSSDLSQEFLILGRTFLVSAPQTFLFQPIFVALVAWMVWADADGVRVDPSSALRALASQLVWVLLAQLIVVVAEFIGTLLLIVPGIIATLALWVTIPACVVERLSAPAAISRSLGLTRGQRWRLLGLLLIVLVVAMFLGVILGLVSMMAGFSFAGIPGLVGIALRAAASALSQLLTTACVGSAYVALRAAKSGVGAGDVAAVFA